MEDIKLKYCNHCQIEHPLTKEWFILEARNTTRCRVHASRKDKERKNKIRNSIKEEITEKECTKCKLIKPVDQFFKNETIKSGYRHDCKACSNPPKPKKLYIPPTEKLCKKCQTIKHIDDFGISVRRKDGHNSLCKKCIVEKSALMRLKNPNKEKERRAKWSEERRAHDRKIKRDYAVKNKQHLLSKSRECRLKNRHKRREQERLKKLNDPLYAFFCRVRNLLYSTFKNKGLRKNTKTEQLLGISIAEFKDYIEAKFEPGMNFSNHSRDGWHIDHILPGSLGKTKEDIIKLCHYTNLQPLWAEENLAKSDKLDWKPKCDKINASPQLISIDDNNLKK